MYIYNPAINLAPQSMLPRKDQNFVIPTESGCSTVLLTDNFVRGIADAVSELGISASR